MAASDGDDLQLKFDPKNFKKVEVFSRGSNGTVTKCKIIKSRDGFPEYVAMKNISVRRTLNNTIRELDIIKKCTHENVLQLLYYKTARLPNRVSLYAEFCDANLRKYLNDNQLTEIVLGQICSQIIRGIEYLHKENVAHGDVKPENILIKKRNEDVIVKIDFGQTHFATFGTKEYASPEIVHASKKGEKIITPKDPFAADIFSLGVIIFEMFTMRRPFTIEELGQESIDVGTVVNASITDFQLVTCLSSMLQWNPEKRPKATELSKFFCTFQGEKKEEELSTGTVDMIETQEKLDKNSNKEMTQKEEMAKKENEMKMEKEREKVLRGQLTSQNDKLVKQYEETKDGLSQMEAANTERDKLLKKIQDCQQDETTYQEESKQKLLKAEHDLKSATNEMKMEKERDKALREQVTSQKNEAMRKYEETKHEISQMAIKVEAITIERDNLLSKVNQCEQDKANYQEESRQKLLKAEDDLKSATNKLKNEMAQEKDRASKSMELSASKIALLEKDKGDLLKQKEVLTKEKEKENEELLRERNQLISEKGELMKKQRETMAAKEKLSTEKERLMTNLEQLQSRDKEMEKENTTLTKKNTTLIKENTTLTSQKENLTRKGTAMMTFCVAAIVVMLYPSATTSDFFKDSNLSLKEVAIVVAAAAVLFYICQLTGLAILSLNRFWQQRSDKSVN